ncbi:CGNR zinc finger domain-containing protein [Bradyrhizobium sp. AUGA SZCCT0177]|uniref:CGNR zinc finger domain-containing protein n=1 Tax=Bradyrhizobium sp. AUGA SZCCT0177 TaxID=2807665 RepID=UPI001BA59DB7|nr:CGNR zinc finger domain-containing protein [Bradyrhizobium sp. AUGA SZCCT0177]MBR1286939.1 CGNR zinc finger domain-containing protein [Bradyrhizobium sp. AUGA SZCCT0177]
MSRESKKFGVPDELANLYDFANTLDVRHFTHHGVPHPQGDELISARELARWMSQRGLAPTSAKITPAMFATAIELRTLVRDYLQCDPLERRGNKDAVRALSKALKYFPLVVTAGDDGMVLRAAREDALAGLSPIVAELYDGSRNGTLDRLKMCASDECRRVFFDRSKPSTRRWCMSSLCGNRMKTRSYRERQRNAG